MNRSIKDLVRARHNTLSRLIDTCNKYLSGCPKGRLRIKRQRLNVSYYHITDNKKKNGIITYDKPLIKALAQKAYLQELLKTAQSEIIVLQPLVRRYEDPTFEDIYPKLSQDRKNLILPYIAPDDEYKENWLNKPYKRKGFKEGTPEYMTLKGDRVRSKSEQIIADRLFINNIPYKYEYPIEINGIIYHTDFRILRMSDRKELFYEHFGKMGDEQYANDNIRSIRSLSIRRYRG
ncbi:MAG: hypothetical protein K6C38_04055 [Saccharofermentans sp.]|nr:hypothetical protein [Saccharofermentans sp.]